MSILLKESIKINVENLKKISDLDKEELEHLAKEEEEKIIGQWKRSSAIAFMAFLGIT